MNKYSASFYLISEIGILFFKLYCQNQLHLSFYNFTKEMPEILILNRTLKHSVGCAAAFKKNRSLVTFQKTNKTFSANITFPSFKFKTWIFRIFFCLRLSLTEKDSLSCKRISPFPLRWWYFHFIQEYLHTRKEIVC